MRKTPILLALVAALAIDHFGKAEEKPAVTTQDKAATVSGGRSEKAKSPLGKKVENFSLKDYRGQAFSLTDLKDRNLVVLAFVGVECPLAKLYAPRLKKLAEEFDAKGVGFVGIDANCQDSMTEVAAYAKKHGLAFPILKDLGNHVAD